MYGVWVRRSVAHGDGNQPHPTHTNTQNTRKNTTHTKHTNTHKKVGDSKPGFFAVASPPDPNNAGVLEFLIKAAGETAERLAALPEGAAVEVSPVQGKVRAVGWFFTLWEPMGRLRRLCVCVCDGGGDIRLVALFFWGGGP